MNRSHILPALAIVVMLGLGGAALRGHARGAHHTSAPRTQHQTSFYEASVICCADFHELTTRSDAVVFAKVVTASPSYVIPLLPAVTVIAVPPSLTGPKATALPRATPANAGFALPPGANDGLVKTDFTVQVLNVLRGNNVQQGQQLTVAQLGGTDPQGNQVQLQGDPLFQIGDTEVLFLKRSPVTGKYVTVGDSQGRYAVDASGSVRAKDAAEFAYTGAYSGKTVKELAAAVQAVQ